MPRNRICYGSFSIALVYLKTHVYLRAHNQIPKYPHANINTQYRFILYYLLRIGKTVWNGWRIGITYAKWNNKTVHHDQYISYETQTISKLTKKMRMKMTTKHTNVKRKKKNTKSKIHQRCGMRCDTICVYFKIHQMNESDAVFVVSAHLNPFRIDRKLDKTSNTNLEWMCPSTEHWAQMNIEHAVKCEIVMMMMKNSTNIVCQLVCHSVS